MSEAMEALERAEKVEHTAHGDHAAHQKSNHKAIGLTMGLIGVLIALCAALVGGERNEMSRSMIEQTQATADATSASTKFRVVLISIEQLRAQPPESLSAAVKERFVRLYDDYLKERQVTSAWANSYGPMIEAHFEAAEGFEHGQVVAEIAIVFASLAVLLGNRLAWFASIVLAVGAIGWVGNVYVHTKSHVAAASLEIEHNEGAYKQLRAMHVGDHADSDAADALDPGGVIRKAIAAEQAALAAKHPAESKAHH